MDITQISGTDLGIVDTDKYCYIMTYSFPCQDLSVAGKQAGMKKGSGTRSGLLWEVERLLNEVENLPQVLLMENVPQVHGKGNMADFQRWIQFLESKGYSNHWQDLNSRNFGVAQNRDRCFMVSILGEWNYRFPTPIPLTKTMKDYLEDEVDEKYYINNEKAQKLIDTLVSNGTLQGCVGNINPSENGINGNVYAGDLAPTLTTNKGEGSKICVVLSANEPGKKSVSNCITAREDRGISSHRAEGNGVIEWKQ
jgi:DNA (cytosine-5)-methyltransferase 1